MTPDSDVADAVVRCMDELSVHTWDDEVRGRVSFRMLFDATVTPTGVLTAGVAELASRGWLGMHRHPQTEHYHLLEGDGLLVVNGSPHRVGAGCSVAIPGNAPHTIRNVGAGRLRFIYTFAVDALAEVAYEWLPET